MRQHQLIATTRRRGASVLALLVVSLAFSVSCTACSGRRGAKTTLVRGEIDRKEWTLRVCSSNERVRVIMPSTVAFRFSQLERELMLADSDAVLVEFEITPISTTSSGPRTVGVMKVVSVKRGSCSEAP